MGTNENILFNTIRLHTNTQLCDLVYRDHLTGRFNRRAYDCLKIEDVLEKHRHVLVDLDSLKWINDNFSYRVGDAALCALGVELTNRFGDENVFRISGDEFAVISTEDDYNIRVQLAIANHALHLVMLHNHVGLLSFSFGMGNHLYKADADLKRSKKERTSAGLRAPRGGKPPKLKNLLSDFDTKICKEG